MWTISEEFWERSSNLDHPEDAIITVKALKKWIIEFHKNFKKRPAGMGHFLMRVRKRDIRNRT